MSKSRHVIAIDPGAMTTGVAILYQWENTLELVDSRSWSLREVDWLDGLRKIRGGVKAFVRDTLRGRMFGVTEWVVELPQPMGSARGLASGTSVIEVATAVGVWVAEAEAKSQALTTYRPCDWKGNMSKQMTEERIRQRARALSMDLSCLSKTAGRHDWDAVGLALHHLGFEL